MNKRGVQHTPKHRVTARISGGPSFLSPFPCPRLCRGRVQTFQPVRSHIQLHKLVLESRRLEMQAMPKVLEVTIFRANWEVCGSSCATVGKSDPHILPGRVRRDDYIYIYIYQQVAILCRSIAHKRTYIKALAYMLQPFVSCDRLGGPPEAGNWEMLAS